MKSRADESVSSAITGGVMMTTAGVRRAGGSASATTTMTVAVRMLADATTAMSVASARIRGRLRVAGKRTEGVRSCAAMRSGAVAPTGGTCARRVGRTRESVVGSLMGLLVPVLLTALCPVPCTLHPVPRVPCAAVRRSGGHSSRSPGLRRLPPHTSSQDGRRGADERRW